MKKLKLFLSLMLLAVFVSAQTRIVPASMEGDMRIFNKEGEDVIVYFPSQYLKYEPKINIVFPKDYDKAERRFCSVYVINKEEMPREAVYKELGEDAAERCLYVNVRFNAIPSSAELEGFLSRELLPYIEVNYKTENQEEYRILLAGEGYSASVLNALPGLGNYFGNFALSFYVNTAMPVDLEGISKNISVWSLGSKGNMIRLQSLLEKNGLKFFDNFAYLTVDNSGSKAPSLGEIFNLGYFLDKGKIVPLKAKGVFGVKSAGATSEERFGFKLEIKGKRSFKAEYIPSSLKIAPPFLSWDFEKGLMNVIYGAQAGKVKVTGMAGDAVSFDASFKISK